MRTTFGTSRYHTGEDDVVFGTAASWSGEQPAGVIFCHGANESAVISYADDAQNSIQRGIAEHATVHLGDLGGTNTWGNDTAIDRTDSAKAYLEADWAQVGPVPLIGISMGVLTAMAYALANPTKVLCIAAVIPALDLNDLKVNRGLAAAIDPAYGGTYDNATDGPTHSPVMFADDLPDIPIRLWTASNDPVCVSSTADAFVAARPATERVDLGALGHSDAAVAAAVDGVIAFVSGELGA